MWAGTPGCAVAPVDFGLVLLGLSTEPHEPGLRPLTSPIRFHLFEASAAFFSSSTEDLKETIKKIYHKGITT